MEWCDNAAHVQCKENRVDCDEEQPTDDAGRKTRVKARSNSSYLSAFVRADVTMCMYCAYISTAITRSMDTADICLQRSCSTFTIVIKRIAYVIVIPHAVQSTRFVNRRMSTGCGTCISSFSSANITIRTSLSTMGG